MKINLFINFYIDKNTNRQDELDTCFYANMLNKELDHIYVLISQRELNQHSELKPNTVNNPKCTLIFTETQPTLNDFFKQTESYPNDINIIANTDIILDKISLKKLKKLDFKNYVLALSRWDFINEQLNINKATHYNHADSQDVWIKKGIFTQLQGANIHLGTAGIDNVIAYLLAKKHTVINPSLTIKTYHYHLSTIRNYVNKRGHAIKRLPPPYLTIQPTILP